MVQFTLTLMYNMNYIDDYWLHNIQQKKSLNILFSDKKNTTLLYS